MSNLSLRERDARTVARIGKLRFSPLSLVGGRGNRLVEEGGRTESGSSSTRSRSGWRAPA